jgi:putative FmdB family regulatory protein
MPIYGYRCSQCGHELEVFQSMSAEPLRVCPECSGSLRKLLYPVGVQFKGSGFYTTDYKNGGGTAAKKSDGAGSDGAASTSSESKSGDGSSEKKDSKTTSSTGGSGAGTSKE